MPGREFHIPVISTGENPDRPADAQPPVLPRTGRDRPADAQPPVLPRTGRDRPADAQPPVLPRTGRDRPADAQTRNYLRRGLLSRIVRLGRDRRTGVGSIDAGNIARHSEEQHGRGVEERPERHASEHRAVHQDRDEYLRKTLRTACEILDRAHREVKQWMATLHHRNNHQNAGLDSLRFNESIGALGDKALWEQFLQEQGLAENERARSGVSDLVRHIRTVTENQASEDSLKLLLGAIELLISEIMALDSQAVSRKHVDYLKETAETIGWQVAAAGAAISASSGVNGGELNYRIILAGLSSTVASAVVGALHDWHAQTLMKRNVGDRTLLQEAHEDLLRQFDILVMIVSRRAPQEPGDESDNNLVRRLQIRAGFMIMYARQLVARILRPESSRGYCSELSEAQKILDAVKDSVERRDYRNADLKARVGSAQDSLRGYRSLFASIHM
jgi:hypothetical protein